MTGMHDDEGDVDEGDVRRLLAAQHPQWAELPLRRLTYYRDTAPHMSQLGLRTVRQLIASMG